MAKRGNQFMNRAKLNGHNKKKDGTE